MLIAPVSSVSADTVRVYHIEDLGFLGNGTYLVGVAMNAGGDIAGYAIGSEGTLRAFRWTAAGGLEDLGTNGGRAAMALGINDNGDVVGKYWDQNWFDHSFIARRGGAMTDLKAAYPQIFLANAISNDGRLTGHTWQGSSWQGFAFRTQPDGTLQEISPYFGYGTGINDQGDVAGVGWHDPSLTAPQTAFRYSDATGYVDLGTLSGGRSGGRSINRDGVIVGWSGGIEDVPTHAFRAKPGRPMEDLGAVPYGFLGGVSDAYSINDAGDVVGLSDGRFGWIPFLYTDAGGMIDLRYRITTAERLKFSLEPATAINNAGQIVAGYFNSTGVAYGTVRLTPVEREFGGPVAAPTVEPAVLTPPDGRMVSVSIDPHVTDEYDPEPICRISQIVNSEGPQSGSDPDVEITYFLSANLRATRLGSGSGRTYTLKLSCTDALGVTSTTDVVVIVPHDSRPEGLD
jgi:probable HAF family extracellular repeat protein